MLRLILCDFGPVQEKFYRQSFTTDFNVREARNDIPCQIDRILLNVGESVYYGNKRCDK